MAVFLNHGPHLVNIHNNTNESLGHGNKTTGGRLADLRMLETIIKKDICCVGYGFKTRAVILLV